MKTSGLRLLAAGMAFAIFGLSRSPCAEVLTFDNLATGSGYVQITNGYGGLNWNNFGALNAAVLPPTEGYNAGMVSTNNVAFNLSGNPATISGGGKAFDLDSAYLTGAINSMQVEVQGFVSGVPTYDNIYGVSSSAPTLVNFNYTGVTLVKFIGIPTGQFAMDNLTVVTGIAVTNPPSGVVDIGSIEVSTLGHITDPVVGDTLIDQGQQSGGGSVLPSLTVNWDTNVQFTVTFSAPPGQEFLVQVPAGKSALFGGFLWWESTRGGLSSQGSSAVRFTGLQGAPPALALFSSALSSTEGFFGCPDIESVSFTNKFAFTSMTVTGSVIPQETGLGAQDFVPHLNSHFGFYYATTQTNDPGPLVTLVTAPPSLQVATGANGDITVAFTGGTLQSADEPYGPYADVPGNPSGAYVIPAANQLMQQFFRVRAN